MVKSTKATPAVSITPAMVLEAVMAGKITMEMAQTMLAKASTGEKAVAVSGPGKAEADKVLATAKFVGIRASAKKGNPYAVYTLTSGEGREYNLCVWL